MRVKIIQIRISSYKIEVRLVMYVMIQGWVVLHTNKHKHTQPPLFSHKVPFTESHIQLKGEKKETLNTSNLCLKMRGTIT